ncbi:hypothetical protein BDF19DRAFT_410253 [Syncephalis fuscata]|nr:hypothetical protein BDF19DRAFT_410253 [Syncephalis fuscata]
MASATTTVFSKDEKQKPVLHRHCFCWSCRACSIFTFFLLLLIALLLGFLVPRIPEYDIVDVTVTAPPVVRSQANPFGFSSQARATVVIDNKNWIDWTFKSIDTEIVDTVSGVKVGSSYVEDQEITKRKVQQMYLPLNLNYTGTGLTDPITLRYIGMCLPAPGKPMQFKAISTFRLRGASIKVVREKEITMKCPTAAAPSASTPASAASSAASSSTQVTSTPTPVA